MIPKRIIVHHSLSRWGSGEEINYWHTASPPYGNGWERPGYHVVICNRFATYPSFRRGVGNADTDGRVDRIWTEHEHSNGCAGLNRDSLHVCLIGDLDNYEPTQKQINKLVDLLVFWCKKYKLDPLKCIWGHGEAQRYILKKSYFKTCPGNNLDMDVVRHLTCDIVYRVN